MSVPEWLKSKSPQDRGRNYEKRLAKKLGTKPQPASGALPFRKEDIELDDYLVQVKHTTKKSYTLKADDLKILVTNAAKIGKIPVMIIKLDGREWQLTPWRNENNV